MTFQKFTAEVGILNEFFTFYCKSKHKNQTKFIEKINYKNHILNIELDLCKDCNKLINYSFERLQNCPYDIKPRCRKCENPCYDKTHWKELSQVMRYTGIHLEIKKIKNLFSF